MQTLEEVDSVELTILSNDEVDFNFANNVKYALGEHGFSVLINVKCDKPKNILFDVGATGDVVLKNMELSKLDPMKIDYIVLSHRHYDHVGGLLKVLDRVKHDTPIICHPALFSPSFYVNPFNEIGAPFTKNQLLEKNPHLLMTGDPLKITTGTMSTGEIPRVTKYEKVKDIYTLNEKGKIVPDTIIDDQAMVVNVKNKGLVIILGCGHAGIINTIRHCQKITNVKNVYAVIGGFHLINSSEQVLNTVLKELLKVKVKKLAPYHCSGIGIRSLILREAPDMFIGGGVGSKILISRESFRLMR